MIIIYKIKKRKMENFEFELIKQLNSENQKENFVISPLGLELVLSLCSNGAEGTTQKEIINLLKYKNIEEVNNNAKEIMKKLSENKEIKLAMGILTKIHPKEKFKLKGKEYGANLEELKNYNNINKWVMTKTNNKIKKIIENLSPDVVMVLLNAIYFEAFWKIKFDMNHTYNREFFNIDETKVYINLMFLRGTLLNYYENDDLKAVKLDYDIKDNSINAIVILPKREDYLEENINDLIKNMDNDLYQNIIDNLNNDNSKTKVNFYLPKFEMEYNNIFNEILKNLKMKKAFTKDAEFKGIIDKYELFINQILQKNYININEEGTQACTATELEIMLESYLTKDETAKDFMANRPFIFIIRNGKCPKGHDIIFFTKVCKFDKNIDD